MNTTKNIDTPSQNEQEAISARALFANIMDSVQQKKCRVVNAGENMGIVNEDIRNSWKPRFLLDFTTQSAYEFIDTSGSLATITGDDIDWTSLEKAPEKALARAHGLDTHFPIYIDKYKNGVARVDWMLNPDGEYYMDADGFGMTNDEEIELTGFIDRQGRPVTKFTNFNDNRKQIVALREEAEAIINQRKAIAMEEQNTIANSKTQVFNVIILDKSGSMENIRQAAIDGFNETLHGIMRAQEKYADTQEHYVSLVAFCSCEMKLIYDKTPIVQAHPLLQEDYQPCCCTPLYDAMGFTINSMRKYVQNIMDAVVVVTIITDGYENASREYNARNIKTLVEQLKTEGWSFTYMGANQDALEVAARMSIRNSRNFEANDQCTRHVMAKDMHTKMNFFARLHGIVRSQEAVHLSEVERKQCYTAAADDAFDEEEGL